MSAQRVEPPELHQWELEGGRVILSEPSKTVLDHHKRRGVPLLFLGELWVPPAARGRGIATGLMRAATRWADRSRTDLWLYADPFGNGPKLTKRGLVEFYEVFGFERVSPRSQLYQMVRRYVEH